jgi:hypothetical protein
LDCGTPVPLSHGNFMAIKMLFFACPEKCPFHVRQASVFNLSLNSPKFARTSLNPRPKSASAARIPEGCPPLAGGFAEREAWSDTTGTGFVLFRTPERVPARNDARAATPAGVEFLQTSLRWCRFAHHRLMARIPPGCRAANPLFNLSLNPRPGLPPLAALDCGSLLPLSRLPASTKSGRGLPQSKAAAPQTHLFLTCP